MQRDLSEYYRVTKAARLLGIPQQSLQAAVSRGLVPAEYTGCNQPLVRLEDVRKYKRQPYKMGRPRSKRRGK